MFPIMASSLEVLYKENRVLIRQVGLHSGEYLTASIWVKLDKTFATSDLKFLPNLFLLKFFKPVD